MVNLKQELGRLLFYFKRGQKTYIQYLENGSTYLYARILKDNNDKIIEVLSKVYCVCPADIQNDILELTHHIDVWSSHWCCLESQLNPEPYDEFIFQNTVRYPKNAENRIATYYEGLVL